MNILIAGGTGLVGSELGKALVKKGHKLFILTRSKEKADLICPFPQTPIEYDELTDHPILPELHTIINLAGANLNDKRWNKKYKQKLYDSRISTTKLLCDVAETKCPKLKSFISTSAVGIYGDQGNKIINEESEKSYEFLGQLCQDWESPVLLLRKIKSAVLRVGIVFSEKGGALAEMTTPIQAGIGGPLAKGSQFMSWIDIDDLVNMYIHVMDNNLEGVFNAVAPNPETNENISLNIANHLNKKLLMNIPYFSIRILIGEMAKHIVESQKVSSLKIQNKGFIFQYKKAKESIEKRVAQLTDMQKRLIFEQWVYQKKEDVFPFFSEAKNLEQITPANLKFKILSISSDSITQGTLINYKLNIDGIPVKWTTLIKDWNPPHHFSDNQEKGPYKKWYHNHYFEDLADGTLMTDQVDLELPLGRLGYGLASWKVLNDVKNIFDYRRKIINEKYTRNSN